MRLIYKTCDGEEFDNEFLARQHEDSFWENQLSKIDFTFFNDSGEEVDPFYNFADDYFDNVEEIHFSSEADRKAFIRLVDFSDANLYIGDINKSNALEFYWRSGTWVPVPIEK